MFSLKIKFGHSSSKNYDEAIKIAKKFTNFQPISPSNCFNMVEVDLIEVRKRFQVLQRLWLMISNWKNTQIYINDKPGDFTMVRDIFDRVLACSHQYSRAVLPEKHCMDYHGNEGWGCKQLSAVSRNTQENHYYGYYDKQTYWYHFGEFVSDTVWQIDKIKLLETLKREVEIKHVELCNFFSFEKVELIVNSLPDNIDVASSDTWEIRYEEKSNGSLLEQKPAGIKPKRKADSSTFSFRPDLHDEDDEEPTSVNERRIPEVRFDDIGGIDEIIDTIREVIETTS